MTARMRRLALVALVTVAAAVALPTGTPAGAEEPDVPFFTVTTGGTLNQDATNARPVVGHFTDQVFDDILWYQPGAAKESLWTPCPDCAQPFTKKQLPAALQVSGTYQPIVADFAGDGLDDIYWISAGPAHDYLWTNTGAGTFTSRERDQPPEESNPVVLRDSRSGDGKDDILWTQYAGATARLWVFPDDGSGVARTKAFLRQPKGLPVTGDFDGNGAADILWYPSITPCRCPVESAASAIDTLWRRPNSASGAFTATTMNIKGEYQPIVGRFSAPNDARDDILWVGQYDLCCGPFQDRPDSLWEGRSNGGFLASTVSFPSAGGALLLPRDGADTALVFDGAGQTRVWFDTTSGSVVSPVESAFTTDYEPVVGRFVNADRSDVFAYYPGTKAEKLYHPKALS